MRHTHDKGSLPCVPGEGARQWDFTVQKGAVCPLSCASTKNARQSLCRAVSSLCRATEAHGKAHVSRGERIVHEQFSSTEEGSLMNI
jgi:hypothetical protein